MQTLKVRMIEKEEVYKDVARIPEKYRRDKKNALIPEGRICKITVNGRSRLLSVRGRLHEDEAIVLMDAAARDALRVKVNSEYSFRLREVGWLGQFLWAWRASDPLYRVAAQLGLISVLLGFLGLVLGIISVCMSYR